MNQTEEAIIVTENLTKQYTKTLSLNQLNLRINRGEIFGFLGHNGAGKTTTINILTTLLEPSSGKATICGFNTREQSMEVRKRIGYLPENVKFYEGLTAAENLSFFARLSGIQKVDQKIDEVLEFLNFKDAKNSRINEFSKGMKQRIGIAQAIIHEPEVLFLDEPTSGLDPMGIKDLRDIILRLNREKNITIFMNTHLLSEVSQTCTTIGVLNHGQLIYKDSLENTLQTFPDEESLEGIYFNNIAS